MAHSLSQSRLSLATIGQNYQNPALDISGSAPPIFSWEHVQTFLSGIPVTTFKSQFINMAHQITRLLKSAEDVIYNPVIVYSLIAVYVNQQVRIYQHCYLQRLYRKLRRHELSPLVLNFLLAYGAAIATESHRDMATRRAIAKVYLDRVKMELEQEVARPTLGTPHLISQIGTLHAVVQENEGFSYYITKGKSLMMERHFHLVDSPVPTHHPLSGHLPNHSYPFTSQQAPQETALAQEFKRRTFWEIYTLDNQVNAMLGLPSSLSATQVTVQPIQDALLSTLFELPPEEDVYPALIPGIRHSLCGYPSLIELALLMGQVADLRAQRDLAPTTPSSHDSRLFMTYLDLGDQHQALAPRLLAEYPLPAYLPTSALVQSYPAYYSSLYTVHASFYAAGILLTIQNWNHGARAFRPNHHPTLYTRGLDLARQFDALIMPVLEILPFHYHTNVFGGTAYLMGYVFSQSLIPPPFPPTFSAPSAFTSTSADTRAAPLGIPWDPAAHLATRQLVHRYLRYLEGLAQHISYVQAYVTLLSRNLAEAEASHHCFFQPPPVVDSPSVVAIGPHAGKRFCH
ncbi:hypothetical protein IWQ60_007512 [Tieghemiomyces parasiticus]|uniref:Xylanolytic transcriptional activator regulatory domain-containing protein n=1 Tax=Tieghemiomyces parasiticus TaxID=78921 RepID=A0A9W8DNV4_9FUNG|nr:hypothetical protein IWQ60_007512 [Tieghemiomyces parasiticus]